MQDSSQFPPLLSPVNVAENRVFSQAAAMFTRDSRMNSRELAATGFRAVFAASGRIASRVKRALLIIVIN